jgi:hypothetical protein
MQYIKLMTDYQCEPLWWADGERVGPFDPASLPLSDETQQELAAWAERYEHWINLADPGNSPEVPASEQEAFESEGLRLWGKLRQELGPDYHISYFSQLQNQVLQPL